jgi:hypothetical protein
MHVMWMGDDAYYGRELGRGISKKCPAGLENALSALNQLFDGTNIGKLKVKVAE